MSGEGKWELEISGEHRLRQENLAFDCDVWQPTMLAEITFPTVFVPLSRAEAAALARYYSQRFLGRPFRGSKPLSTRDVAALRALEALLGPRVAEAAGDCGAFLRLCGRSPKDGDPFNRAAVRARFAEELRAATERRREDDVDDGVANLQLCAIARTPWLRVACAHDAMSLLLTSERVYADMRDWLDNGEPEQICLRRWEPRLTYDREFRLFVCRGRCTAVTQYDHFALYRHILRERDAILARLLAFWRSQVAPRMRGVPSYVVDLGDLGDSVVLIEISPFLECTGTALFSWKRDRAVLCGEVGSDGDPPEFRLRETVYPNIEALVEVGWHQRWEGDVQPYWHWYALAVEADVPRPLFLRRAWDWLASWWWGTGGSHAAGGGGGGKHLLFVYGTLKRGFHWCHKYLSRTGAFVCKATSTLPYPLVLGECGVPYLLGDVEDPALLKRAHRVVGEVWRIDAETLEGLDEYEGVTKGHYRRVLIPLVTSEEGSADCAVSTIMAECYFANNSSPEMRARPYLAEYTLDIHRAEYNPILHILVKQQLYLGRPLTFDPVFS